MKSAEIINTIEKKKNLWKSAHYEENPEVKQRGKGDCVRKILEENYQRQNQKQGAGDPHRNLLCFWKISMKKQGDNNATNDTQADTG